MFGKELLYEEKKNDLYFFNVYPTNTWLINTNKQAMTIIAHNYIEAHNIW